MKPQRIQLSRRRGFDLQAESRALNGLPAVNCARPGPWGNPYRIGVVFNCVRIIDAQMAVDYHRDIVNKGLLRAKICRELAGLNLACWCRLSEPCHCDTLLEIANGGKP